MKEYTPYYNGKKRKLKNTALLDDLEAAKEYYQRGDLSNAREILFDIVVSIDSYLGDSANESENNN